MKKFFLLLLILFTSTAFSNPIKKFVFFGDSLTDNGNLYHYLKFIPKSPPYYQGRFSNGTTWADNVGDYFLKNNGIESSNYGVGGATVVLRSPFEGFLPVTLGEQIDDYLVRTANQDRSDTLFFVWMGANDYLNNLPDIDKATTDVVNKFISDIRYLISHGGKNFVILNLPDLSKAPYAKTVNYAEKLHLFTLAHNEKLASQIDALKKEYSDLHFMYYDANALLANVENNLEKYNTQYHMHIKNLTEACWDGKYTLQALDMDNVKNRLRLLNLKNKKGHPLSETEINNLAIFLKNSPAIQEANKVTQQFNDGLLPCSHPEEYSFWDHVHPTQSVHYILGQELIQKMQNSRALNG